MKAMLAAAGVALLFAGSSAQAGVIYATGFEPPTFTTGLIAGQDGWSEYPSPSAAAQVESAFVYAGSQAVNVIPALAAGQDGPYKAVSTAASIVVQSRKMTLQAAQPRANGSLRRLERALQGSRAEIDILANNQIELIAAGLPIIGTTWTRDAWINVALTL